MWMKVRNRQRDRSSKKMIRLADLKNLEEHVYEIDLETNSKQRKIGTYFEIF